MSQLSPDELMNGAKALDVDPEKYVNDPTIEYKWAMKAYQHAETYFNLLSAIDPQHLKLTKKDDEIYERTKETFGNFEVGCINENELKSAESKEKWRPFCESFKGIVEDYNFATLIRIDSTKDYSEENTTIVPRIQFYAFEIVRNREGFNKKIKELYGNRILNEK